MGSVERLLELIDAEIMHNSNNTVGGRWSAELHEARQIAAALREQPEARGVVEVAVARLAFNEYPRWWVGLKAGQRKLFGREPARWAEEAFKAGARAAITQQPVQEGGGEVCPRCKGAGEYEGFARHASGDPQDEYAATVQCEPCEGTGEVAAPPSAPVGGRREIDRVIRELRAYNPAADEYRGEHIHGVWAKELERALTQQPAQAAPGDDEPPRCPKRGYTEEDCRTLMDHRLCGEPDPPAATPPGDDAAGGGQ